MEKLVRAMASIGEDERLRALFLDLCRDVEGSLARRDFDVREEVTGPIIDALHENVGLLKKQIHPDLEFHFHYRSKIARDFVMSEEDEPDHVWEPQTTKLLLHLSRDARHVVIGGAYSGDHAILVASLLKEKGGTCHCFEPNQDHLAVLRRNADVNKLNNIAFNDSGLWESDDVSLILVGDDALAHPEVASSSDDPNAFSTITLKSYGQRRVLDRIDVIFLDIEGGELAALRGADHYLSQPAGAAPRIIFEVHRHYVDWSEGLENTEIIQFLRQLDYSVFAIRDYQSNVPMAGQPIELIPPAETYLEGPPHGFNMLAVKGESVLNQPLFRFCSGVSPKLLRHRDPKLHQPLIVYP